MIEVNTAVAQHRAIKYRIYPNEDQKDLILRTFGCARLVYNETLSIHGGLYEAGMKAFSKMDMNNYCNRFMKDDMPFLRDVDKFALTNSIYDAFDAFKNFFEKRTGYPRFKSRKAPMQSYSTNMTKGNIAVIHGRKKKGFVQLPKLGRVSAYIHRMPATNWKLKAATVSMDSSERCYVSVLFELPEVFCAPTDLPTEETTLGLDYSSPKFYVDSNGNTAGIQHWYRRTEKRLATEQRKLSHCIKGSNRYEKQKQKVNRIARKVSNQRKDFCHKKSREITNLYNAVCVEDMDLKAIAQSLRFGKAVSDNGFGMFRNFLRYKLEEQGKYFIPIDKWFPSTKTCRHCGEVNPDVQLGQSVWTCPHCGAVIDRDLNAAINIRNEGLRTFYLDRATA